MKSKALLNDHHTLIRLNRVAMVVIASCLFLLLFTQEGPGLLPSFPQPSGGDVHNTCTCICIQHVTCFLLLMQAVDESRDLQLAKNTIADLFCRMSLLKKIMTSWQAFQAEKQQNRRACAHWRLKMLHTAFAAWFAVHKVRSMET